MGLERWQEAIAPFKAHVGRYPYNLWAHEWLALCHFNLRDQDGAQAEFAQLERIAALNPSAVAYSMEAFLLNALGKPTEALSAAAKGMRFDPRNPWILWTQGWPIFSSASGNQRFPSGSFCSGSTLRTSGLMLRWLECTVPWAKWMTHGGKRQKSKEQLRSILIQRMAIGFWRWP